MEMVIGMEKKDTNLKDINPSYLFLFLLMWTLGLLFPIVIPLFGVLCLTIGILTRKNAKLSNFAILSIVNGILLITLAFVIYTVLVMIK